MAAPEPGCQKDYPALTGRIVDGASLFGGDWMKAMDKKISGFEAQSGHSLVIATTKSLEGLDIAKYSRCLGNHWAVGGQGNGLMVVVAPHERQVRIAVGTALENRLTYQDTRAIIDGQMLPLMRQHDYAAGLDRGIAAIMAEAR
ncbi:MAG: hypothetical protein RL367_2065 [Pseudomonadota bacterium]